MRNETVDFEIKERNFLPADDPKNQKLCNS